MFLPSLLQNKKKTWQAANKFWKLNLVIKSYLNGLFSTRDRWTNSAKVTTNTHSPSVPAWWRSPKNRKVNWDDEIPNIWENKMFQITNQVYDLLMYQPSVIVPVTMGPPVLDTSCQIPAQQIHAALTPEKPE